MNRITKLYISNFMTGLVFWYGIEKLFMQSIGIDAAGIGLVTTVILAFTIIFDVPAGLLADKWSRKGQLIISAFCLMACSVILGISDSLTTYTIGALFYGAYLVNTSGSYQAITYDILHEEGKAEHYSKIQGRSYALFFCGAGAANIASGFIARAGLEWPFFASIIPPILNILLIASIHEPRFHKELQKEKFLLQFAENVKAVSKIKVVRSLALAWCVLAGIIGLFTQDFSQLYMLKFTQSSVNLGLLWAIFAFALASGSYIAHRIHAHLSPVIMGAMGLIFIMALTEQSWSLIVFMLYAVMHTVAVMLIETQIQHNTPSAVRASILSFLSTLSRIVALPTALFLGWLIRSHNVFSAIRFIAIIAVATFIYWLLIGSGRLKGHEAIQEVIP